MVTRACTALLSAALFTLVLCTSAGAAKPRRYAFGIPDVSMSEVMTFHGDASPDCVRSGVCGYSGTVRYGFSAGSGAAAFIVSGRHVRGTADFFYEGLTSASVQEPGGGPPCSDKVLRSFDGFEVEGTPGRVRLLFHPYWDVPQYLSTYCAGPSDVDMSHANALPEIVVTERALRRHGLHLEASTTRPFHSGPFAGTLSFEVNMRLRRAKHLSSIFQFLAGGL